MVAGQPSSQPVVGDDTGTLADTGSQRPSPPPTPHPVKHHRKELQEPAGWKALHLC